MAAAKTRDRSAARLAAVQALYQMDIVATPLPNILAEFENHWIGQQVEGDQYRKAEAAFFRDIVTGIVREQRAIDPLVDDVLSENWPLKRVEAILRAVLRAGAYELSCDGTLRRRSVGTPRPSATTIQATALLIRRTPRAG